MWCRGFGPTTGYGARAGPERRLQVAFRGKREPGASPGLPRSGEWERTPSTALAPHLGAGKRRSVGVELRPRVRRPASARARPCAVRRGPRGWVARQHGRALIAATSASSSPPVGPGIRRAREERAAMTQIHTPPGGADTGTEARAPMVVRKRNGDTEPVDLNKIVRAVERCADGLSHVEPLTVATRTISGLYDGATTAELDRLSIQTAAELTANEPEYSRLAARLLAAYIEKEVAGQQIASFSQSVRLGRLEGLIGDATADFVEANARKLDQAVDASHDRRFEYFGLRTVYDRYLLRHPETRLVVETPQYWLMRVACGLATTPAEAIELYRLMASLAYLPSSPTLFNSGTRHTQMSSCYLVDSPRDELESIYARYGQVAALSKFAGGIGISFSRVRSRGALIRGTNGTPTASCR